MEKTRTSSVAGILLVYHHSLTANAPTIMEHVKAFELHSRFPVWKVNTELGFPPSLKNYRFQIIVLHYSVFGNAPFALNDQFKSYIEQSDSSYKIAFFQDEYHHCSQRFAFLNRYRIDCVYTLVEPAYWKDVYLKFTNVPKLIYQIPGYVSDELVAAARKMTLPDARRTIDVGYRGRQLPFYMGKGAQEKTSIATAFLQHSQGLGLRLDIETEERQRLYGKAWKGFVSNCRAFLGVEAGVSLFDIEDKVRAEYDQMLAQCPKISFEEMWEKLLYKSDGNIPYRMISPRHFEAAAFRVCQVLFEGHYSGAMKPLVHYIPLKKDFSNFDDVIRMFNDRAFRHELAENTYRDLIADGQYSYRKTMNDFDEELIETGRFPNIEPALAARISSVLRKEKLYLQYRTRLKTALYSAFPGRRVVAFFLRPALKMFRGLKLGED